MCDTLYIKYKAAQYTYFTTIQSHVLQHKLQRTLATVHSSAVVHSSVGWRTIDSVNYVMRTQPLKTQDKLTALQCTTVHYSALHKLHKLHYKFTLVNKLKLEHAEGNLIQTAG